MAQRHMVLPLVRLRHSDGFTMVELMIACVVFPMILIGLSSVFSSVQKAYSRARELNEVYAVLSACPEIDRALDYDSITSTTNCYPNNSFATEGGSGNTITYTPTLTITSTSSLSGSDPLQPVYDSKVVDVSVGFPSNPSAPQLKLRMLITRNGIGQL